MQKHVNLVDLVKSFPTNIFLQNLASIQKRTSHIKFAYLAEKSEKGSISNLSTKVAKPAAAAVEGLIQEVTAYRVFMKNPQWYVKWTADNSESWETWDKLDSDHLREKARELEKAAKNDGL